MFLKPGTVTERLYAGQEVVQVILLLIALCCVPVMLFLKPFYLRWENNRARAMGYRGLGENTRVSALDDDDEQHGRPSFGHSEDGDALITQDIGGAHGHSAGDGEHEEFEFSEVMIHQVIHTIGMRLLLLDNECLLISPQSSVSTLSRIPPPTYDYGPYPWRISSSRSCFGA